MQSDVEFFDLCILHRDAKGFLEVAASIHERNNGIYKGMEYYVYFASPYAVNLSFSIELSIKELWMLLDIPSEKAHYLDYLYSKLPEDIKERIEAVFKDICNEYTLSENCNDNRVSKINSLDSVLQTYARAFEDWRYLHECNTALSVPHGDLMCAAKAIREIAGQEMQKYCIEIGENPDYM